jgi:hypothetical protein
MRICLIALALTFCFTPLHSLAEAFKCTDASGKLMFSDRPCANSATKSEKIMGRGAGYSKLTAKEREEFKQGVGLICPQTEEICECYADGLASSMSYEEVVHIAGGGTVSAAQKQTAATMLKRCIANNASSQ